MKKIHYVLGVCAIVAVIVIGIILLNKPDNTMAARILPATFTDLIGTRVASTTTGVAWYNYAAASTTYPFSLGGASEATIVFGIASASTTEQGNVAHFSFLGSNDPNCSTATTSTIYNLMTKAQIRWFDAAPFLDNASVVSSFDTATSTINWPNAQMNQRAVHFSSLNMECLAVEVNASSTVIYANYRLKD